MDCNLWNGWRSHSYGLNCGGRVDEMKKWMWGGYFEKQKNGGSILRPKKKGGSILRRTKKWGSILGGRKKWGSTHLRPKAAALWAPLPLRVFLAPSITSNIKALHMQPKCKPCGWIAITLQPLGPKWKRQAIPAHNAYTETPPTQPMSNVQIIEKMFH